MKNLLPNCLCGHAKSDKKKMLGLNVLKCKKCGVIRQEVRKTQEEYQKYYEKEYHQDHYSHTYNHDVDIANIRLDAYNLDAGKKLLDIGSGNGAFVIEARKREINAFGNELSDLTDQYHDYVLKKPLHENHIPDEEYDYITMHDILEHIPDIKSFVQESARILKDGGTLIIDFPDFFHMEGKHHWKPVEHIWLLNQRMVERLVIQAGLQVDKVTKPIPSKLVFYVKKDLTKKWI